MTKLPLLPYRKVRKLAESVGFVWIRCLGSHNVFHHPDGRVVVVPDHGAHVIVRPLFRKILRDLGLSPAQFVSLLPTL